MSDVHQMVLKSLDEYGQKVFGKLEEMRATQREFADRILTIEQKGTTMNSDYRSPSIKSAGDSFYFVRFGISLMPRRFWPDFRKRIA